MQPRGLLPFSGSGEAHAAHGPGRRDAEDRVGMAKLWKPAHDAGAEGPRLGGEPQAGSAAHAARQSAVCEEAEVVVTTDSAHGLKVHPNLASSMILTGM